MDLEEERMETMEMHELITIVQDRACRTITEQSMRDAKQLRDHFDKTQHKMREVNKENQLKMMPKTSEFNDIPETVKTSAAYTVNAKGTKGLYKGKTFIFRLSYDSQRVCPVGRSAGRKYRSPKGMSLPKDMEVSTNHGEFSIDADGSVFYKDVGSTNGSGINGLTLEEDESVRIHTDQQTKLSIGACNFQLTFQA